MIYLKDSKKQMKGTEDSVKVFQDILALEDRIEREKEHFYVMMLAHNHPSGEAEPRPGRSWVLLRLATGAGGVIRKAQRRLEGRGEEEGEVGVFLP